MRNLYFIQVLFVLCLILSCKQEVAIQQKSFCNPLNISYRFALDTPSRREGADPTIMLFKDKYYLFVSKSGGYWYSNDLAEWNFIESTSIPTEEYAPTTIAIGDTVYFLASSNQKSTIYKTDDPGSGNWTVAKDSLPFPVWDPAFFMDDDNRLYLYWGCSNVNPIYGIEVDYKNNFDIIGEPVVLFGANPQKYGWENPGDNNELVNQAPWIEGAWMNKFNGQYYLQYAGPGTEFKTYADGVYTSKNPLGPFALAENNPFSARPRGFISGAGHGSTFMDKYGNYWHVATITISVKHMFERRIALFPTFFDSDGVLHTSAEYGDFPLFIPQKQISDFKEIFPEWMLLSYGKNVTASSIEDSFPVVNANDEDIRTYWAAKSGNAGEWIMIDLEENYDVYAFQINFAEHKPRLLGREDSIYYKYLLVYSDNGIDWKKMTDKTENITDIPHDYVELSNSINCRYLKLINYHVPDGNLAISGLRIFGKGAGEKPNPVENLYAERNKDDARMVRLSWNKAESATGYTVRFGSDEDKLYSHVQVFSDTSLTIRSLNSEIKYYFSIESFNENGITKNDIRVIEVKSGGI